MLFNKLKAKKHKITLRIHQTNKECLKQKVKVLKLHRELDRPTQILKFIDVLSRQPRALEKHKLADEIKLKYLIKSETVKLD